MFITKSKNEAKPIPIPNRKPTPIGEEFSAVGSRTLGIALTEKQLLILKEVSSCKVRGIERLLRRIELKTGISIHTARYNLKQLKRMGLITWKRKGYVELTEIGEKIIASL